jgi:hypothetical protein
VAPLSSHELFITKSLSLCELYFKYFKQRTVLHLKLWAIRMCATLFFSKLRSNPCAKLDINLLYIELCIVMRIVVSLRYQEWS